MQSATAVIETRSQREALDWSLALISQGIENVVQQRPEDAVWVLGVAEADRPRALQTIQAYEHENASVWRQEIKWTGLLFDWRSLFAVLLWIAFFALQETARPEWKPAGMVIPAAVEHGEWWRLFTAVTLHADIAHLAANASTGLVLLGLAMGAYGAGSGLLWSFVAGAAANWIALWLRPEPHGALGASGMVMGALGLLAVHSFRFARPRGTREWLGRGVLGGFLLLVLLGLGPDPETDVLAHVAGFFVGAGMGLLLCLGPVVRLAGRKWLDHAAGILCALLLMLTWALALRSLAPP